MSTQSEAAAAGLEPLAAELYRRAFAGTPSGPEVDALKAAAARGWAEVVREAWQVGSTGDDLAVSISASDEGPADELLQPEMHRMHIAARDLIDGGPAPWLESEA